MRHRWLMGWLACTAAQAACALELADPPTGLAWSRAEVEAVSEASSVVETPPGGNMHCVSHCAAVAQVWQALQPALRQQLRPGDPTALHLVIVQSDQTEAYALPGGTLVLSEHFVRERKLTEAQIAFVLAHEATHVLMEHERQTLTLALHLLPREVKRSVQDVYTELAFNRPLQNALQAAVHQVEFEADELGLLLAAMAGYPPDAQLVFMQDEVGLHGPSQWAARTHPHPVERLQRLQQLIPLAERLYRHGRDSRLREPG
jgi:Zn-dependent protease with chaperone function